jgi:hypothetical protein
MHAFFFPISTDPSVPSPTIYGGIQHGVNLYAGIWGNDTAPGAGHGSEIGLVFGATDTPIRRATNDEERQVERYK